MIVLNNIDLCISELAGKKCFLEVSNEFGTTIIPFELKIKPQEYTKEEFKGIAQTDLIKISVKFKAQPSPISCHWQIDKINIPSGKSKLNGNIQSSLIYHDKSIPNEYLIDLSINPVKPTWVGKNHSLSCTNEVNTTVYLFKLPKQEEILAIVEDKGFKLMSSTSLIIIVVLILVFLCGLFLFLFHHMQR